MRPNHQLSNFFRQLDSTNKIFEQLSEFTNVRQRMLRQLAAQSYGIHSAVQAAQAFQLQIGPSMDAIIKSVAAQIEAARNIFDGLINPDVIQRFRERLQLDQETVEAFNAAGWPIAPSMPLDLRHQKECKLVR